MSAAGVLELIEAIRKSYSVELSIKEQNLRSCREERKEVRPKLPQRRPRFAKVRRNFDKCREACFNPAGSLFQPTYENILNFLERDTNEKCEHSGPCDQLCPCRQNKTTCEWSCKCARQCHRRFSRCTCQGNCESGCSCRRFQRECILGECGCTQCTNVYEHQSTPALEVRQSSIPSAGEGLFAADDIIPKSFMGEYTGQVVCHGSNSNTEEAEDDRMVYFQISKC